jgi:hypothetical protein
VKCHNLEDSLLKSERALQKSEAELAETRRGATSAIQGNSISETLLADKEAEIMSLRSEVKSVSEDLKKAKNLIEESRESFQLKSLEAIKVHDELQKSIQACKDLEEKLKNIQKEFDCQRHNAESVKSSMEKKLKDQVKLCFV